MRPDRIVERLRDIGRAVQDVFRRRRVRGPRQRLGSLGEALACRELERRGYHIVGTGARTRFGEIDIVALDGESLVIVEVKTRSTRRFGPPVEAVGRAKQRRLVRLGRAFAAKPKWRGRPVRFDVVGVDLSAGSRPRIKVIQGAFEETWGIPSGGRPRFKV